MNTAHPCPYCAQRVRLDYDPQDGSWIHYGCQGARPMGKRVVGLIRLSIGMIRKTWRRETQ